VRYGGARFAYKVAPIVKLILVENDPLTLACTQDALAEVGFEVLPAINGTEALALLSDTPGCPAMMVDVFLEGQLDGWEVARLARRDQPDIAIIYTTTAEKSEYKQQGVDRSVLLQKPYPLERAVSAALEACKKVG
jgi:CheY-like chemotaxis protein